MAWPGVSQRMVTMRFPRNGPAGSVAGALQRGVEGDARPDQETDEVVAPDVGEIAAVVLAGAVDEHRIARAIGAQVGAWREPARNRVARIGDLEHRAGALVALAVEQEVEAEGFGQYRQVALHEAGREPAA